MGQTADVQEGCAPLLVQFQAPASATSYYWDFGDGGTSVLENPAHTFATPQTYTVEFRESATGPLVGTITITVYPKPVPELTADPESGCLPLSVTFDGSASGTSGVTITNYMWTFGDGGGTSGMPDPTHTYSTAGTFTVSLGLVTDKTGCDTTVIVPDMITVSDPPPPSFVTNPSTVVTCDSVLTVDFANTTPPGAYTLHWDLGNGTSFDGPAPPPQTYQEGTYAVTLTLTDSTGCSKSTSRTIGVGSPRPSFDIPNDTLCLFSVYQAINTSPSGSFVWTFQDATPPTSTQESPYFRFNSPGPKTITLSMTSPDGLCTNDTTITVFVEDPTGTVTVDPTNTCSDPVTFQYQASSTFDVIEWLYFLPDGQLVQGPDASYTYVDLDTTTYSKEGLVKVTTTAVLITAAGCKDTIIVSADVNKPNALFLPNTVKGCAPLTVTFADLSTSNEDIISWHWELDDGTVIDKSDSTAVTHTYTQPGEYHIWLAIENSSGCRDTSYVQTIYVGSAITPDFSVDKTDICIGDTVYLSDLTNNTDIDAYHYTSDGDRLSHCYQSGDAAWAFYEPGSHDVTLDVIYNGCQTSVTKNNLITVHGPRARITYEMDCASPMVYQFNTSRSQDFDQVTWDFGDGTTSTDTAVTHTYSATGDYTVVLTVENTSSGCAPSSDTVVVHVRQIQADFTIPDKVCRGQIIELDASNSQDVNVVCHKGFQWVSSERPTMVLPDTVVPTVMIDPFPYPFYFSKSGDQWVELVVQDVNGCSDTLRRYTRVYGIEDSIAVDDSLICLPGTVNFTSFVMADTTVASWTWDFGDGAMGSGANVSHTYTSSSSNVFQVALTVKDVLGCDATAHYTIQIYKPTSSIITIPAPPVICVGDSITFTATDFTAQGSFLNYSWDFGNGMTSNTKNNIVPYNSPGTYPVTLTYTEDATGCTDQTQITVTAQSYPTADFVSSVDGQGHLCYPLQVNFTDMSTTGWPLGHYWDFGNGQQGMDSLAATVLGKGVFDITHVVTTSAGCADTIVKSIETVGPEGDFSLDKNIICLGEEVTVTIDPNDTVDVGSFHFDFGDGTIIANQLSASHAYTFLPGSNQQPIKLVLTSVDGLCSVTLEKTVTILNTQAEFTSDSGTLIGCEGVAFDFVNQSMDANQYHWDFGDGHVSTQENPFHVFSSAGTYTVTLAATDTITGCTDTVSHDVLIRHGTPVKANDVTMCVGDTATLSVEDINLTFTYSWSPATYLTMPNAGITGAFPPATMQYVVSADDGSGCIGTDTATVFVVEPLPNITFDTTVFAGTTVTLPVTYSPPYVFSWDPESGLSCLVCSNPTVTPEDDITYHLTISDDAGCFTSSGIFVIRVFPENVEIPNAFTPNHDGVNDFFNVVLSDDVAPLLDVTGFRIYDRWGQKVYDNDTPDTGWDGKFKGKDMPSDTYVYIVEVTFLNGKQKTLKGEVTLIR